MNSIIDILNIGNLYMTKNYGFSTFLDKKSLPLAEVLIESIPNFSKHSILGNCI